MPNEVIKTPKQLMTIFLITQLPVYQQTSLHVTFCLGLQKDPQESRSSTSCQSGRHTPDTAPSDRHSRVSGLVAGHNEAFHPGGPARHLSPAPRRLNNGTRQWLGSGRRIKDIRCVGRVYGERRDKGRVERESLRASTQDTCVDPISFPFQLSCTRVSAHAHGH